MQSREGLAPTAILSCGSCWQALAHTMHSWILLHGQHCLPGPGFLLLNGLGLLCLFNVTGSILDCSVGLAVGCVGLQPLPSLSGLDVQGTLGLLGFSCAAGRVAEAFTFSNSSLDICLWKKTMGYLRKSLTLVCSISVSRSCSMATTPLTKPW